MAKAGALDVVFLVGADEINVEPGAFVVYIGSHGDRGAHRADVILPGAAYTEKSGTYVNTEGRVQMADRAAFPPGDAREDWAIFRALSGALDKPLPFDSLAALRSQLYAAFPHLARIDAIEPARHASPRLAAEGRHGPGAGRSGLAHRRFLPDQPDRPRLACHGRMFGPGQGPHPRSSGGMRTRSSWTSCSPFS